MVGVQARRLVDYLSGRSRTYEDQQVVSIIVLTGLVIRVSSYRANGRVYGSLVGTILGAHLPKWIRMGRIKTNDVLF